MGAFGNVFGYFSGGTPYNSIDPFLPTQPLTGTTLVVNNGAVVPVGTTSSFPLNPATAVGAQPYKGQGVPLTVKYVRYGSVTNPNFLAQPGLVYWTDDSYTTVSGAVGDSAFGNNGVAGYILINTTQYPGSYTGATLATLVNNGYSQSTSPYSGGSFVWIAVGGYLPGATSITSTAAGDWLIGSATAFTPARIASGSNITARVVGQAATALSGAVSDVLLGGIGPF